jgi:hypothetical protein
MNSLQQRLRTPILLSLLAAGLMIADNAKANVYASNIKVNGTLTNSVSTSQGSSVTISYILNEAATAGVTINISSGGTPVRTISIPSGTGTAKGLNTVNWDGKNGTGNNVTNGTYSVSITAAATGFADWTITSDNTSPTTYSFRPYGIAVDKNTNSPYYGRVFVAASQNNANGTATGDTQGIVKCNADGSYADDGAFSRFDYTWYDDALGDSPVELKVLEDDNVYFNDWAVGKGRVIGVDPALTHSFVVWDATNYSSTPHINSTAIPNWLDFDIAFIGTDHPQIFNGDITFPSVGLYTWYLTNKNGHLFADPTMVRTNEDGSTNYSGTTGQQVIQVGGDLPLRCDGVQVDANTNIYILENRANPGDPAIRTAMFANWDGITDLFVGAAWTEGSADDTFRGLRGYALDSRTNPTKLAAGNYTSVAVDGTGWVGGGIRILNPADGSVIYTNLFATNYYRSVAWDNAGNLYAGTSGAVGSLRSHWQQISPPGANQATTAALVSIQVGAASATPPQISSVTVSGGNISITFSAGAGDSASAFTLRSASVVTGPFNPVGVTATQVSPGVFNFTTPISGSSQFYRISR